MQLLFQAVFYATFKEFDTMKYQFRKSFTYYGRRYYIVANSKNELNKKILLKMQELEENKFKASNMTVAEWSVIFFETYKEPYILDKSFALYITLSNKINSYIGNVPIKRIISSDLQRIINSEYKKGLSKSYIDKLFITIKQLFRRAKIDKKIIDDPSEGIIKPKMQENSRRALSQEERTALLHVAKSNIHGSWVLAMLYMGLRPSETALIQEQDINLAKGLLHVRGTKTRHSDRYIPIPSKIDYIFKSFDANDFVFTNGHKKPNTEQNRKDWWKAFKRDMDIFMGAKLYRNKIIESVIAPDLTMYCLRHTYGTDLQAAGVPINITRELMGHSDISITSKYYIHSSNESTLKAKQLLENFHNR